MMVMVMIVTMIMIIIFLQMANMMFENADEGVDEDEK